MSGEDVIQRAASVIVDRLTIDVDTGMGGLEPLTDVYTPQGLALVLAQALHDAGLLAEPKPVEDYVAVMQDVARVDEAWRLRGEFIDALARSYAEPNGWLDRRDSSRALVAHLDNDRRAE